MNLNYFNYNEKDIFKIVASQKDFLTIMGPKNEDFINNILNINSNDYLTLNYCKMNKTNKNKLYKLVGYASIKLIDSFVGETIKDELAFGLESEAKSKKDMISKIEDISKRFKLNDLEMNPFLTDLSTKAKISIARSLIMEPKVLILDNILCLLNKDDKRIVLKELKEYNTENLVINFTCEIEECLLGNKVLIADKEKVLISGETLSVLNEEKILKRLGYSMPFIVMLNKYLIDYDLINKYYLSYESLVNHLWK